MSQTAPLHHHEFDGHPVADWIVPRLEFARRAGWRGVVLSGVRTEDEQLKAAAHYAAQLGRTVAEVYPHGALASNHVGDRLPRGAVDVTHPDELDNAMVGWRATGRPHPLVWAARTIGDRAHFSANGH